VKLGIIGAGAWGTALAQVAASGGEQTLIWAREPEVVAAINGKRENTAFLPRITLSDRIEATTDLAALTVCDALLVVTPAQHMRSILADIPVGNRPLILCAKGIEADTQLLMSQVASAVCQSAPIAVLSGPTFAHEVAQGLPTAITLACEDAAVGQALAERIAQPTFRPYASADVIGAEIGGAVKNVLAIACGVVEGAGLGQNARAALIARGFAEMTRMAVALGCSARKPVGGHRGIARHALAHPVEMPHRKLRFGIAAFGKPKP
jgi:glycerol-3-phosphate dehydrogenase (NAD(P)+)